MISFDKAKVLNQRAIEVASSYLKSEAQLLTILQELDRTKAFLHFNASSLYQYCTSNLKLSDSAAANLIAVARKAVEIPELKKAVESGEVTISKARRIASVITKDNKTEWLELARTSTSREIEKEVARVNPQLITREKLQYKTSERLEVSFGISEQASQKLKRVKDLIAQKKSKLVTTEEAFEAMLNFYLEKEDPVEKAKRVLKKKCEKKLEAKLEKPAEKKRNDRDLAESVKQVELGKFSNSIEINCKDTRLGLTQSLRNHGPGHINRARLPSVLQHAISLRDLRQCTYVGSNGIRCNNKKWLDIHHIVPVARGGANDLSNLTTLCSAHHKFLHRH